MNRRTDFRRLSGIASGVLLLGLAAPVSAQIESLTVTLLPASVGFTLTSGSASNAGTLPIAATTTWVLSGARSNVALYAYFTSASVALAHLAAGNTVDIPAARVEVSINGGTSVPFNQTPVFGAPNAGRQIFSQTLTLLTRASARTDTLALNINLAGYMLPADTYTGALRIRAQASP
jgi:hypothetical protein